VFNRENERTKLVSSNLTAFQDKVQEYLWEYNNVMCQNHKIENA
jgi:hypothetical protein